MIIWSINPNPIDCLYPFIATPAQVVALGFDGRLALSNSDQTGTLTAGSVQNLAAFPDTASPQTFDLTAGKKVIEFRFVAPDLVGPTGEIEMRGAVFTSSFTLIAGVILKRSHTDAAGLGTLEVNVAGSTVFSSSTYPIVGGEVVVGLEFDSATNTLRAIADSAELSLSASSYSGSGRAAAISYLNVIESSAASGADIGKNYAITARTSLNRIAQVYGAGATDICGNPLA